MMRVFLLSAAFALFAVPALAYPTRCVEPYAPVIPDGRTITKPQLDSVREDVKRLIAQSDQYQECLLLELKTERQKAQRKGKEFDPRIEVDIKKMITANQRNKERVGAEYNGAANAYNEAHPKTNP